MKAICLSNMKRQKKRTLTNISKNKVFLVKLSSPDVGLFN